MTRAPADRFLVVPETRRLLEAAMREVETLARARGVTLADDVVAKNLAAVDRLPAGATASMQRDVMEGRPSELDAQSGAIVRMGRESGVPTPATNFSTPPSSRRRSRRGSNPSLDPPAFPALRQADDHHGNYYVQLAMAEGAEDEGPEVLFRVIGHSGGSAARRLRSEVVRGSNWARSISI